ncbi:MAG: PAS domain S-box protein [Gammaproteobacteria bacterium]|nr:PAS domain S-box protein [Gammaproteobacteria bacterium]
MTNQNFGWRSLRYKLILASVLVEVVMLSVLVWNSTRLTEDYLIGQTQYRIQEIVPLLNASIAGPLFQEDLATLNELLKRVQNDHGLSYVSVSDTNRNLIALRGTPRSHDTTNADLKSQLDAHGALLPFVRTFPIQLGGRQIGYLSFELDTRFIAKALREVRRQGVVIAIVGIILSIGLLMAIGIGLTSKLQKLASAVSKLPDEIEKLPSAGQAQDEIGHLTLAFNKMADQVHARESDRDAAIAELADREQHLALTLDSIGDGVIATDITGRVTNMNPVAETLTGWMKNEAMGLPLTEILTMVNAATRATVSNPVLRVLQHGKIVGLANHTVLIARDRTEYHIADSAAPIRGQDGKLHGVILVFRDVSKEYQTQQTLVANEQRMRLYREQTPLGVIEWKPDTKVVDWNPAATQIFGYSKSEAVNKSITKLIVPVNLEQQDHELTNDLLSNKGSQQCVTENQNKHGELLTCEWYNTVLTDTDGEIISIVSLIQDITEQQKTEEILRRSQKMEVVDQLSGGIAHDFNNQLGVIIGYLDFLDHYHANENKPKQWVEIATKAALHCRDLTRQLLSFSRHRPKEGTSIDINATLEDMRSIITRSITPAIELNYRLDPEPWIAVADPHELQDAILNLVINAKDAMSGSGALHVETKTVTLDQNFEDENPGSKAGDYIVLSISDTGCGMSKEILDHAFEPFFTTKDEGKGTGLGLSMVYGFVKRYGGYLKVYSELDIGTTVHVYLPRQNKFSSLAKSPGALDDPLPTGSETVLIVDDEHSLLILAQQHLSDLGYTTYVASSAKEALDMLGDHPEIVLLFTDVVMPGGMNGYELAQKATAAYPGLKVLLTSGFISNAILNDDLAKFGANLLTKPYRKRDLAQHLRHTLDREPYA